jgi:hypothetical protein
MSPSTTGSQSNSAFYRQPPEEPQPHQSFSQENSSSLAHQERRRYVSHTCDKSYYYQGHLESHIRKYTGGRPVKCQSFRYCGRSGSNPNKIRHEKLIHAKTGVVEAPEAGRKHADGGQANCPLGEEQEQKLDTDFELNEPGRPRSSCMSSARDNVLDHSLSRKPKHESFYTDVEPPSEPAVRWTPINDAVQSLTFQDKLQHMQPNSLSLGRCEHSQPFQQDSKFEPSATVMVLEDKPIIVSSDDESETDSVLEYRLAAKLLEKSCSASAQFKSPPHESPPETLECVDQSSTLMYCNVSSTSLVMFSCTSRPLSACNSLLSSTESELLFPGQHNRPQSSSHKCLPYDPVRDIFQVNGVCLMPMAIKMSNES